MAVVSMTESWQRPASIGFPHIWRKFETFNSITGKVEKFWIQDIPENMFETVIQLTTDYFYVTEPIRVCTGFSGDQVSVAEEQDLWRQALKQRLSLICFAETAPGAGQIACIYISCRCDRNDPRRAFQGSKISNIALLTTYLMQQANFYQEFDIFEMVMCIGSVAYRKYYLPEIFVNMLECRRQLCMEIGIRTTLAIATSEQAVATTINAGFIPFEIFNYEELANIDERFRIPGIQRYTQHVYILYRFLAS